MSTSLNTILKTKQLLEHLHREELDELPYFEQEKIWLALGQLDASIKALAKVRGRTLNPFTGTLKQGENK